MEKVASITFSGKVLSEPLFNSSFNPDLQRLCTESSPGRILQITPLASLKFLLKKTQECKNENKKNCSWSHQLKTGTLNRCLYGRREQQPLPLPQALVSKPRCSVTWANHHFLFYIIFSLPDYWDPAHSLIIPLPPLKSVQSPLYELKLSSVLIDSALTAIVTVD